MKLIIYREVQKKTTSFPAEHLSKQMVVAERAPSGVLERQ
jgi:hypothetical protein